MSSTHCMRQRRSAWPKARRARLKSSGVKVSIKTTHKEGLVVGMHSMTGNPHDGHTLEEAVAGGDPGRRYAENRRRRPWIQRGKPEKSARDYPLERRAKKFLSGISVMPSARIALSLFARDNVGQLFARCRVSRASERQGRKWSIMTQYSRLSPTRFAVRSLTGCERHSRRLNPSAFLSAFL